MERYPTDQLLRLAAEKDPGFTIPTFRDALGAIRRFDPEDWNATGIDQNTIDHTQQMIARLNSASSVWR
jgi:hypothetical protein